MPRSFRLALAAGALCLSACNRVPDTDTDTATATATPPAPADPAATHPGAANPAPAAPPTANVAAGTDYACADGTRLQADFGAADVTLRWPDGRTLVLPRAESASRGGGDAYVGEDVSLQRDGARLQLHDGDRAATDCEPGAADAFAARYACDAATVLVREADGSFRAEMPGNPPVRLTRIAGSTPPVFTGSSLYLRIGDGEAILSQGDRTDELHCRAG